MQITVTVTKYVHSCVLIETRERNVLFDPGSFSWKSGLLDVDSLPELHDIVVTHEHADHYDEEFVRSLIYKFPNAQWITNTSLADKLKALGAQQITTESTQFCKVRNIPHAIVAPFGVPVDHVAVDWNGLVTHPGDTLDFDSTCKILHLPITAPWGTTVDAMDKIKELKPKYVLPIHDWMLRPEWLDVVYARTETLCSDNDVKFIKPTDGQKIELEIA